MQKCLQGKILFLPLHRFSKAIGLSHGVMVALQFLVLSVEVRILVRQLTERKGRNESSGPFLILGREIFLLVSFLHN